MSAQTYRTRAGAVQAVQFHGSTTQRGAIAKWIRNGGQVDYVEPTIQTCDIQTSGGWQWDGQLLTCARGDYVVHCLGRFFTVKRADFEALLELETDEDPDRPAPCDMRGGGPYNFAWCVTHDTTFALGDKCRWDGVTSITEHLEDRERKQRGRANRAEVRAEAAEAEVERLRAPGGGRPVPWRARHPGLGHHVSRRTHHP